MGLFNSTKKNRNQGGNNTNQSLGDKLFQFGKECEESDPSKAFDYFIQAAEMGSIEAMNKVGFCYLYHRNGAPFDIQKSLYWFQKGANEGDAKCMMMLSQFYISGVGVPQSYDTAKELMEKAAKVGDEKTVAIANRRLIDFQNTCLTVTALMETIVEFKGRPPKK